jgi:uncharacterized protein YjiS (DUF1127 family)
MTMMTESQSGAGSPGAFISGVMAACRAVAEAMRFRRTLRILSELDDHALRDIGLTRSDLFDLYVATSPIDALATLKRIRRNL